MNSVSEPMFELVAADAHDAPNPRVAGNERTSGKVHFDGIPPGRYFIRLGRPFRGFEAGQVVSEVEVTAGATTEVFLRLVRG